MKKGQDDIGLMVFSDVKDCERMENGRIAKRVHIWGCIESRSVGRPQKRWTETVKEC